MLFLACTCSVKAYIRNGWDKKIINPDGAAKVSGAYTSEQNDETFNGEWIDIKSAYSRAEDVPSFTYGNMITYFVTRTVTDGLPANDFKSINKSAKYLFDCGHVQNVQVGNTSSLLYIRANCLPEMRKDHVYRLVMSLQCDSMDVTTATCGCPAGKGPVASCKHVGALCYAFAEFCSSGKLPEFFTDTQKLQRWNQPRARKVEAIPVVELRKRREEILKSGKVTHNPLNYDPRPASLRFPTPQLLEPLRINLLEADSECAFSQLLAPPVSIAMHDHTYCTSDQSCLSPVYPNKECVSLRDIQIEAHTFSTFCKNDLNVTEEERKYIEISTRNQSQSSLWYSVRQRRITGSKCGRILNQHEPTPALLSFVLYSKPLSHIPEPIKWGIDHESHANQAYLQYVKSHGKQRLITKKCGFIIHPTLGWLGASPDAFVTDPHSCLPDGIAEFKCPYSKREMTPIDACQDPKFYCFL